MIGFRWMTLMVLMLTASTAVAAEPRVLQCDRVWNGQQGRERLRCTEEGELERDKVAPRSRAFDPLTLGAQTLGAGLILVPAAIASVGIGLAYDGLGGWRNDPTDYGGHTTSMGMVVGQALIPTTTTIVGRAVGGSGPWWSIAVGSAAGFAVGLPVALATNDPFATMGAAYASAFLGGILSFHLASRPRLRPEHRKDVLHVGLAPTADGGFALSIGGRL